MWTGSFNRIVDAVLAGEVPALGDVNSLSDKAMLLVCEVIRSRRLREELELARKQVIVKKIDGRSVAARLMREKVMGKGEE